MNTELTMLTWTLVLAFVQILAFDIARTGQYGLKWNTGPRDEEMPPLSAMAERLRRAQNNLFETLPLFIAAVLIAHVAGKESSTTALGAQIYFLGPRGLSAPLCLWRASSAFAGLAGQHSGSLDDLLGPFGRLILRFGAGPSDPPLFGPIPSNSRDRDRAADFSAPCPSHCAVGPRPR